jgi:hypothetical protein
VPSRLAAQNLVITNARIITGAGTVIERGSIVVRDGHRTRRRSSKKARTLGNVKVVVKGGTMVVDKR